MFVGAKSDLHLCLTNLSKIVCISLKYNTNNSNSCLMPESSRVVASIIIKSVAKGTSCCMHTDSRERMWSRV